MIELDESYFTVKSSEIEKDSNKRGRGAVGQQNVAIMAESVPLYLDEFVCKLNRRYFGEHLFDRLVLANITAYERLRICKLT